jgi:hypothetical protein
MADHEAYEALALGAITATDVPPLLASQGAVVLERIARGGGATRWYFIQHTEQLTALAKRLSPGSSVSFYFDDRISAKPFDHTVAEEILAIAAAEGEAVIGRLSADGIEVSVEFVSGPRDLDEATESITPGERVFFGAVPARDNDAVAAVTLDLPDRDGIIRPHPH